MKIISPGDFPHKKVVLLLVATVLCLTASAGMAGTWTVRQWNTDRDLPEAPPDMVTHAIAFGIDPDPPVPEPFVRTDKISGEKWSVWIYPGHEPTVCVDRRPDYVLRAIKVKGEWAFLLQGRLIPKNRPGGLSLELSGLEPGRHYSLALFGLGFATSGPLLKVVASDAPDQSEEFKPASAEGKEFFVYDYTAPPNGKLAVFLESAESNKGPQIVRLSAFLNCRSE